MKEYALYIAWLITLIGVGVSLAASELLFLPPCPLCWVQRCSLYPLALILGIAAYRDDRQIYIYTLPLALIGAGFAFYQFFTATRGCSACSGSEGLLLALFSGIGFSAIAFILYKSRS